MYASDCLLSVPQFPSMSFDFFCSVSLLPLCSAYAMFFPVFSKISIELLSAPHCLLFSPRLSIFLMLTVMPIDFCKCRIRKLHFTARIFAFQKSSAYFFYNYLIVGKSLRSEMSQVFRNDRSHFKILRMFFDLFWRNSAEFLHLTHFLLHKIFLL